VRLGQHNIRQRNGNERTIGVDEFIVHDQFARRPTPVNNIAIIKLSSKVEFSDAIVNICPPPARMVEGSSAYLAGELEVFSFFCSICLTFNIFQGFGSTAMKGPRSDTLRHVEMPIWNLDECQKAYASLTTIEDSMICAGPRAGGRGFCEVRLVQVSNHDDGVMNLTSREILVDR
jgi:Trypsin